MTIFFTGSFLSFFGFLGNHGDFVGVYEFEFEGEKAVLQFTIKNDKLWAHAVTDDYEVGELTPDKKQPTLFRGTTVHGEHWAFEFAKEAEGKPARCKFIDEDLGLEIVGNRSRGQRQQ